MPASVTVVKAKLLFLVTVSHVTDLVLKVCMSQYQCTSGYFLFLSMVNVFCAI